MVRKIHEYKIDIMSKRRVIFRVKTSLERSSLQLHILYLLNDACF